MLGSLDPLRMFRTASAPAACGPIDVSALFPEPSRPKVAARHASYEGGHIGRLNKSWIPPHRSADSSIDDSWDILNPRVRDLQRNNPIVISAERELVKHTIGTGIMTFADVVIGVDDGMPIFDDDFNYESDELFERWADEEFDVEGKRSFPDAQWQAMKETVAVGETLFLKCMLNEPWRSMPLAYQMLEPEQLDVSMDRPAGQGQNRIVRGVELDRFNRPVAYYIFDAHPYDNWSGWTTKSTRITADRVIHQFLPFRPSQTRGISWLAALIQPSRDVDWYLGNELTAAAIGALLTLIVKRDKAVKGLGMADGEEDADEFGNELFKLGRGNVAEIGKDESVEVAQSERPNRDAGAFIKLMHEQAAMAGGVSYIRLTSDLKATSYTAARAAHLHDAAYFRPIQNWVARTSVIPMRRQHTGMAAGMGLYSSPSARQFLQQQRRWTRLSAQGPGREQLDPEKETDAAGGRMRMGVSSLPEENALMGRSWRKTLQQQARAMKYAAKLGVRLDFSKGASPPNDRNRSQDDRDQAELDDAGQRQPEERAA